MPVIERRERKPVERDIMALIRAELGKMPDVVLFRNNTGMLKDARGVPLRYGLATGSADLIGSLTVVWIPRDAWAGPDRTIARALAIEVKQPGKLPTQEQANWLAAMRAAGWLTGIAHSVEEAVTIVEQGRRWQR